MGRINRIWYPGATYHVMCRGNRRGDIFREEEDYVMYLRIVRIAKGRYPFLLYDYCLMTNHVHLQLQTLKDEIWFIMQYINTVYSGYYNIACSVALSLHFAKVSGTEQLANNSENSRMMRWNQPPPTTQNI